MENNEQNTQTENSSAINYESEYKKMASDYAKMKEALSKSNSENAEYKRKEKEKLSEEEKRTLEFNELVESKGKIENELKLMKLEKEFLANGFTAEETDKLIKGESSPKVIAEIVKAKVELAISSLNAKNIVNTITKQPLNYGNGNNNDTITRLAEKNFANSKKYNEK